jgi:hypothetical protein
MTIRSVLGVGVDFVFELVHEQLVAIGRRKLGIPALEERLRDLEARDRDRERRQRLPRGDRPRMRAA